MALLQKKRMVVTATEFSKLDIKTGALTYNQQYNRCTIPLLNKPFVQLQGLAEPIRSFDDSDKSKSSYSISFLAETSDDFDIYANAMKNLGIQTLGRHEENVLNVLGAEWKDI